MTKQTEEKQENVKQKRGFCYNTFKILFKEPLNFHQVSIRLTFFIDSVKY